MKLLGFEISRTKKDLAPVSNSRGGFIGLVREPFSGAWQRGIQINQNLVTSYYAVFSCVTLIASDIAKLDIRVKRLKEGVWQETKSNYDALLRKPNNYQTWYQFAENWFLSKLLNGNTYILKGRDNRGFVNRLWILDPCRVQTLVSTGGDVFYQLMDDTLTGVKPNTPAIPASEMIHDRMNCLFHPLVGLSPIYAAGLAATQGLSIQNNSTVFFSNRSIPGGIITSPNTIPEETAKRLKDTWDSRYGPNGDSMGKTAVLGDGLEFKSMAVTATDAQMIEQLKWTAENVCSCFHVPPYKIGLTQPSYNNVQALNVEYLTQCLQQYLEAAESCLEEGLSLKSDTRIEFDEDCLLRMDTVSQVQSIRDAVGAGVMSPNEGRAKLDLPPATGGESPYLQQQNYSLEALAKRDTKEDPFATSTPPAPPNQAPQDNQGNADGTDQSQRHIGLLNKGAHALAA